MENKNIINADLLLVHGYLITMDNNRQIFEDGAIAIKNGEIVAIGQTDEIIKTIKALKIKDLGKGLVHPGLIDTHQHTTLHLIRGWNPDYFSHCQLIRFLIKPFLENVTIEDEFYSTVHACMEMVLNGTTTFGDTGSTIFDVDNIAEAIKMVGIRGRFGYAIGDNDTGELAGIYNLPIKKCLRKLEHQVSKYPTDSDNLIGCWVGMFGGGNCSDKLLRGAKELADSYNTVLNMHQSYTEDEIKNCMDKYNGKRPIEHLNDLGLLSSNTSLVHMIYLNLKEVDIIEETKTGIISCLGTSTRWGLGASIKGLFPEMIDRKIPVGLGTDAGICSDALDICRMMYLAAIIFKEVKCKVPMISAEKALEMATLNGARIMGMEDKIGSLKVGKRADIVIHNLKNPESNPPFDPLNNLIFSAQSKSVDTVIIDGNIIVEDGEIKSVDSEEMYRLINDKAFKLSRRMNYAIRRK